MHELAQVNIARLKIPLDSPQLKDFPDALDPVNAAADAAQGFVRRLQDDSGRATDVPFFGDDRPIVNLTVWRDADALTAFMYQGRHREMPARRGEWSERLAEAVATLWWVPAGHRRRGRRWRGRRRRWRATCRKGWAARSGNLSASHFFTRGQQVVRRGLTSLLTGSLIRRSR
ncbi:DUF3291 domain-containing protein [Streptomyces sp. b94]|uniref:DUF3291 domain-containing protein n=1 Tax=Streptomyces sp. b94 TaxID=1827634 RepID=UPI0027DBCB45|nr:DUF3291 domain-containing protein [Streptomyces sp. b94]